VIGTGAYLNSIQDTLNQIQVIRSQKGTDGVIFYSYDGTNKDDRTRGEFLKTLTEDPSRRRLPFQGGVAGTPQTASSWNAEIERHTY